MIGVIAAPKLSPRFGHGAQAGASAGKSAAGMRAGGQNGGGVASALRVRTVVVQPQALSETVNSTGSLVAEESVELQAETAGKVVKISFEEGAHVKAGQLLVKLNDADLQATLQRARHHLDLAQRRQRRTEELQKNHLVREDEYDASVSEVNVQYAEIALIKAQIARTEIHAPFSGVVGLRYVSEGAYINASSRVALLQRLDRLKIDFSIPEKYSSRIRIGSPIRFTVAGSDVTYHGEIYAYEPYIDQATRTVLIRARVDNSEERLLPGAFASVELTLATVNDALLVPAVAIIPSLDEKAVYVVNDGHAGRRVVETGLRTDRMVQVVSGIQAGDAVITSGVQQLRPGMAVAVEGEPAVSAVPKGGA